MGVRRRRNEDEQLIQGEPSVVRRSRRQNDRDPRDEEGTLEGSRVEDAGKDQLEGNLPAGVPQRGAERPSVAEQASQQVAAILEAGEEAVAEMKRQALEDADALRERLLAEAQSEADGIRTEAQTDARNIRREGHAAVAALREEAIVKFRDDVERICARLGEELLACARHTIEAFGDVAGSAPMEPGPGRKRVAPDR